MDNNDYTIRLTNLYNQSHNDLLKYTIRLTKNREQAEDLISELYEYLMVKGTPKLYWGDSFNTLYCQKFIHSRFINRVKRTKQHSNLDNVNPIDEDYDVDYDTKLEEAHTEVINELKRLERTKKWAPARIFQLYMMSDKTLEEVASDIGISKSTTFLSVKKIRTHLQTTVENPFKKE